MPRRPPPPKPLSAASDSRWPLIGGSDLIDIGRALKWRASESNRFLESRARRVAAVIDARVRRAAMRQVLAERQLSRTDQQHLADDVGTKAAALLTALGIDADAAAAGRLLDDVPVQWRAFASPALPPGVWHLADWAKALPPGRGSPHMLLRWLAGAPYFEEQASTFPDGLDARERVALFAAMTMLPDALGALLAMARAAGKKAQQRPSRQGRRPDDFGPAVVHALTRAYRWQFGAWPKPHRTADRPSDPPHPVDWVRAVLRRIIERGPRAPEGLGRATEELEIPRRLKPLIAESEKALAELIVA